MTRARWPGILALGTCACLLLPLQLAAQEVFPTGAETWTIDATGTLSTGDWPVESAFKLSLTSVEGAPKDAAPTEPKDQPAQKLPELSFASDYSVTMIGAQEGKSGTKMTNLASRSVRFDVERRALRVLDVITSSDSSDRKLTITYTTRWQPAMVEKLAKPREFTVGNADSPSGALVTVSGDSKLPVLMFIFGAQAKGWVRKISATKETLEWSYTGTLAAHQRVVLLHWLALTDDARTDTLRQARAALIQQGMPADASLNAQVLKELVNYPMAVEADSIASAPATEGGELHFVKALGESLKIERSSQHDQMVVQGGPLLKGDFSAAEVRLQVANQERAFPTEQIAAIQGGAGIGRKPRVFLRDGTVVSGVLAWKKASFKEASLGTLKLSPENLDTVILRISDSDQAGKFAALWVAQDGDVHGLPALPEGTAHLRWAGGDLDVAWKEIVSLRQLPLPELGQEISLRDGSRIHAWFTPPTASPLTSCAAYAASWDDLMAALANKEPPPPTLAPRLQTTDGSNFSGMWGQDQIELAASTGVIHLAVAEIQHIRVGARADEGSPVLEIATAAGSTLRGSALTDTLSWKHGGQLLQVPWLLISEIATSKPPPAKQP